MSDELDPPPASPNPPRSEPDDELGLTVAGKIPGADIKVNASARGFYAGFLLAAGALTAELIVLGLTGHQLLTVVTGIVAGFFLGVGTMNARLKDAKEHSALQQREIDRMATAKTRLEDVVLKQARLSSQSAPIVPIGKKRR